MGVNNVKFFEQHVEKIVLGAAAAGALFMGYMAFQPVTITSGKGELGPNDIENMLQNELGRLEEIQRKLPVPAPKIQNHLENYQRLTQSAPLDAALVSAANFPQFGPKNLQPRLVSEGPATGWASVTPNPVGPEMVRAEARQDQVAAVPIDPANPIPAGKQLQTRTQNSVVIDGYVPVGRMVVQMLQEKGQARIPVANLQRGVIYRILVERQEQTAGGVWSNWEAVAPTKASARPSDAGFDASKEGDLMPKMDLVEAEFKQIVIPDFYPDGQGKAISAPILGRPVPPAIAEENKKLQTEIDNLRTASSGFQTTAAAGGTASATQPTTLPSDLTQLKAMPFVPFTFWDETVQPNRTYRYRLEVQLVNPTFGWKAGLKDEKMKTVALLSTGKVMVQQTVTVHSDVAFFLRSGGLDAAGAVSGIVLKQVGGKWYMGDFSASPGQNIVAVVPLIDQPGNKTMEVDTGYALVDAGAGARVILKDPSGNLISRDPAADWNSPDRTKLSEQAQKRAVATTAPSGAGEEGGPTPPPPPPPPPPPTRSTRIPVRGGN